MNNKHHQIFGSPIRISRVARMLSDRDKYRADLDLKARELVDRRNGFTTRRERARGRTRPRAFSSRDALNLRLLKKAGIGLETNEVLFPELEVADSYC